VIKEKLSERIKLSNQEGGKGMRGKEGRRPTREEVRNNLRETRLNRIRELGVIGA